MEQKRGARRTADSNNTRQRPCSRSTDTSGADAWQNTDAKHVGGSLTQMHIKGRPEDGKAQLEQERNNKPRTAANAGNSQQIHRPGAEPMSTSSSMLWNGAGELEAGSWAPSGGTRGSSSWGLVPNVFEVDGRPGTRGGVAGPSCELDGRPSTRSGGARLPSRMQTGMQMAPMQQPGGAGQHPSMRPSSRAQGGGGASSSGPSAYNHSSQQLTVEPPSPKRTGRGPAAPAGLHAFPPRASRGMAAPMHLGATTPRSTQQSSSIRGGGLQQQRQQHTQASQKASGTGRGHTPRDFTSMEGMEQLLEALSDNEDAGSDAVDARGPRSSLNDLNNYLSALDQNDVGGRAGPGHNAGIHWQARGGTAAGQGTGRSTIQPRVTGTPQHPASQTSRRAGARGAEGIGQPHSRNEQASIRPLQEVGAGPVVDVVAPSDAPSVPAQYAHLPHKAVRIALKLVNRMVEQAVKTGQLNLLIKEAECKELAEEQAMGGKVVLPGEDWQAAARCHAGAVDDGGLSGLVNATWLLTPGSSAAKEARDNGNASCTPRPDDDFRHLAKQQAGGATFLRRQQVRPASRPGPPPQQQPGTAVPAPTGQHALLGLPLGPARGAGTAEKLASPGMARYGMHRL